MHVSASTRKGLLVQTDADVDDADTSTACSRENGEQLSTRKQNVAYHQSSQAGQNLTKPSRQNTTASAAISGQAHSHHLALTNAFLLNQSNEYPVASARAPRL